MEETLYDTLDEILRQVRVDLDTTFEGQGSNLYLWSEETLVPFDAVRAHPEEFTEYHGQHLWAWVRESCSNTWGHPHGRTDDATYYRVGVVIVGHYLAYPIIAELPNADGDRSELYFPKQAEVALKADGAVHLVGFDGAVLSLE